MMKRFVTICIGLIFLMAGQVWSQTNPAQPQPAVSGASPQEAPSQAGPSEDQNIVSSNDRMMTPPPVSGQSYPAEPASQERSNYLRGGVAFTSAYTDNALGSLNGTPVSDISYSVAPMISLDETTSRVHWLVSYAPGFTFYQRFSSRNEADQNASIDFEYRLSPHVTLTARDGFQKSSSVFNQANPATSGPVSGGVDNPNLSVIAPIADRLSNGGNVGLTYQFGRNSLVGASGSFSNLHYPDPSQVPGLFDSSAQSGLAFYSWRISNVNYFGATYQYQRLVSYPVSGLNETQTHALFLFYTLQASRRVSVSIFAGPQYSDTVAAPQFQVPPTHAWTPAGGASLGWQAHLTSFALSYAHEVSSGGGLIGAVRADSASASVQQQIARRLFAGISGSYAKNNVLGGNVPGLSNGHSIAANANVRQQFGEHFSVLLGYTRLHQSYSNIPVLALTPDTNREFISLSYQFSKALGR